MSILFSGDFHANAVNELSSITKKAIVKKYGQEKFDSIKYHIILGDGGFMWPGNGKTDLFNYKVLDKRPFPILCVIGNHEPMLGKNNLPETDIGIGETVYQINDKPFTAYLKRGKMYKIDKIKFLCLGGALSIDKINRIPDLSWWEREYWTAQEERDLFGLLEKENNFDFVISHTGPDIINRLLFKKINVFNEKFYDKVAQLNDEIYKRIKFREWWCGHWHQNVFYYDNKTKNGYQYLYKETKILSKIDRKFVVYNEFDKAQR